MARGAQAKPLRKLDVEHAKPERIPTTARLFIAVIGLAGLTGMAITFRGWIPEPQPRFIVYLLLALATSGMKVAFPGVRGTISLNFVVIMLSLVELTPPETMFLAVASAAAQIRSRTRRFILLPPVQGEIGCCL